MLILKGLTAAFSSWLYVCIQMCYTCLWRTSATQWPWIYTTVFDAFSQWIFTEIFLNGISIFLNGKLRGKDSYRPCGRGLTCPPRAPGSSAGGWSLPARPGRPGPPAAPYGSVCWWSLWHTEVERGRPVSTRWLTALRGGCHRVWKRTIIYIRT